MSVFGGGLGWFGGGLGWFWLFLGGLGCFNGPGHYIPIGGHAQKCYRV